MRHCLLGMLFVFVCLFTSQINQKPFFLYFSLFLYFAAVWLFFLLTVMARGIWIHIVVLMLKHAYLSPSERVYHTWRAALHLEISIIIKKTCACTTMLIRSNCACEYKPLKKGKTSKDLGKMCVHTYWQSAVWHLHIFTFIFHWLHLL